MTASLSRTHSSNGREQAKAMRRMILCADDYGMAPGVSRGIRELIAARRLSATSCMTQSRFWHGEAEALLDLGNSVDIGLHLTLTDQEPLTAMPRLAPDGRLPHLARLKILALTGRLDDEEIAGELDAQLDAFVSATGRPPDFIDGHQHVQQVPGVTDIVIAAIRQRARNAYLRVCWDWPHRIVSRHVATLRCFILAGFAAPLALKAARAGVPFNPAFGGVNTFDTSLPFSGQFERFLHGMPDGALVMCHPGHVDGHLAAADPVTDRRRQEYDYFRSDAFPACLRRAGMGLARFGNGADQTSIST